MMGNVVILRPPPPGGRMRRPWPIAVDVDGLPTDLLALHSARTGRGAAGATAAFEWTGSSAEFGAVRRLVRRGAALRARLVRATFAGPVDDWPIFDGHLVDVRVEFDGGGRRIVLEAIDGLRFRHGGTVLRGRHGTDRAGRTAFAPDRPVVFNAGGRPNRSAAKATVNGRSTWLFEDRPAQAAFWSSADAIDYLLAAHLADDSRIALPSSGRLAELCGDVRPRDLDLTGTGLLAALEKLGEPAGATFAVEPRQSVRAGATWRMRWFGPGGGRRVVLRHQRAGRTVSESGTNVASADLAFDHDSARHLWLALGEPERVESTFPLVAGWDRALEGQGHRAYTRANPDFAAVRDVYRRWVLNETGEWTPEPFDRGPAADLSGVFATADYVLRPRRLGACLSLDAAGRSRGVVVEVSYDGGESWQSYPGRIEVLADEAGVRFDDDQLPTDYWLAAAGDSLAIRVTATLESDRRVRAELEDPVRPDGRPTVEHLVRLPGRYRRQWVDADSRFAGGPADEIDDRESLSADLAEFLRRGGSAGAGGRLTLPWLSALYQVGDRVRGISGQGLSFAAGDGRRPREPLVAAVTHELGDRWQTSLELG